MAKDPPQWTLQDLIDFECEIATAAHTPPEVRDAVRDTLTETMCGSANTPPEVRDAVLACSRTLAGAPARRVGLRVWLEGVRSSSEGKKFMSALGMVGAGAVAAMFLLGITATLGLLERARMGIHVMLFLAILLGTQWLVLTLAVVAWLMRRRAADGFSVVQSWLGKLVRRVAGNRDAPWWHRLMNDGGPAREAMLWRLARMVQAAGVGFNAGILCGLAGLVLVKNVGFFWETTTEFAMRSLLERLTFVLSLPWASWWPGAVPDAAVIDASRWLPERVLPPGPTAWWQFLLMVTLGWGLLPRLALWWVAWRAGHRALSRLDFQARAHRVLWRELIGVSRVETEDQPLDGVLVLDVGGSGLSADALRRFLLRGMRVNPAVWQSVAVLDPDAEQEAFRGLAKAPAGVVLLAEGWALSPARMRVLQAKVRTHAGPDIPIKFLIANSGPDHTPLAPSADECREWERFVDSLRDPAAEVFFYQDDPLFV